MIFLDLMTWVAVRLRGKSGIAITSIWQMKPAEKQRLLVLQLSAISLQVERNLLMRWRGGWALEWSFAEGEDQLLRKNRSVPFIRVSEEK